MKIKLMLLIIFLLAGPALVYGQKHTERTDKSYYRFEFQKTKDSVPSLYCVITLKPENNFEKLGLAYDGKQDNYQIQDILKKHLLNATFQDNKFYVLIPEHLKVPYVVVTATADDGSVHNIWLKDSKDKFINPKQDMVKWKKSMARLRDLDMKSNSGNSRHKH